MADQKVPITPGSGVDVDVTETTRIDGTLVERQRMVVVDDSDVDSAGQRVAGEEGNGQAFVRDPELVQVLGELTLILKDTAGGIKEEDDLTAAVEGGELEIEDDGSIRVDFRRGRLLEFVAIDTATSGDNVLVKAQPGQKIKVLSYVFVSTSALAVRFISKPASGTAKNLSGAMAVAANGGASSPAGTPSSWIMETEQGQDLVLNLSAATQVSGHLAYFREP